MYIRTVITVLQVQTPFRRELNLMGILNILPSRVQLVSIRCLLSQVGFYLKSIVQKERSKALEQVGSYKFLAENRAVFPKFPSGAELACHFMIDITL